MAAHPSLADFGRTQLDIWLRIEDDMRTVMERHRSQRVGIGTVPGSLPACPRSRSMRGMDDSSCTV